jgi:hypothetical protein
LLNCLLSRRSHLLESTSTERMHVRPRFFQRISELG